MSIRTLSRIVAAALVPVTAALALTVALPAGAREGDSIGHGVKCYWVTVQNPDGSFTHTRVFRKGD